MTLLLDATVSVSCDEGTDLAQTEQIGSERQQLSNGAYRQAPKFGGAYVAGLPFGEQSIPIVAPIKLLVGDKLKVVGDPQERFVWEVFRSGKLFWENKAAKADEAAAAQKRAEKWRK